MAVIGSGIAGLTSAYLLQRRYDVTLYEADDRLGGHARTHEVAGPTGSVLSIDSGFIVHNAQTYPNLLRLFGELGISTQPTEMSMSISCRGCGLEYAGTRGFQGVFAHRRSPVAGRFLHLLAEVPSFHRRARALLRRAEEGEPGVDELTLGDFLIRHRHTRYFVDHFVIPLVSAVWSADQAAALAYPARYLFTFLNNHGMLSVAGSPRWRTVVGGSSRYVEQAAKGLNSVRTATPIRGVRRHDSCVEVRDDADSVHRFDHVVIAANARQARRLLTDPTPDENAVLGTFRSSVNETVLHTDHRLLPSTHRAWASWNYTVPGCAASGGDRPFDPVRISYHMNRLQRLGRDAGDIQYLVSLGAADRIDPDTVIARMMYEHPVHTRESVAAQRALPSLNTRRTVFAGSWQGWGFHEDGCASGVAAAAHLGVQW